MEDVVRIAQVDNQFEADLLDQRLANAGIPHVMQSFHDSAYDGIFQQQQGWGAVLAPEDRREEVLAQLEDIRAGAEANADDADAAETEGLA